MRELYKSILTILILGVAGLSIKQLGRHGILLDFVFIIPSMLMLFPAVSWWRKHLDEVFKNETK